MPELSKCIIYSYDISAFLDLITSEHFDHLHVKGGQKFKFFTLYTSLFCILYFDRLHIMGDQMQKNILLYILIILKARVPGVQTPETICNFPQIVWERKNYQSQPLKANNSAMCYK